MSGAPSTAAVDRCPVCRGSDRSDRFTAPPSATEGGVDADRFRPSDLGFGRPPGLVVACDSCGHGWALDVPAGELVDAAYADAEDPVSLREEDGQVATADRALAVAERHVPTGRLLDVGCWTGSFLVAAEQRGWSAVGIEPSRWASERGRARGLDVRTATFGTGDEPAGPFDLVVMCDVLEHLADPGAALDRVAASLVPGGALLLTVPDAGSRLARTMGRRWWSVLPMHLQYFTRPSMHRLLAAHGFTPVETTTHAKLFTVRYYAERLGGYAPALQRAVTAVAERIGVADRLVAPDFRDRMLVVACVADRAAGHPGAP